MMKPIILSLVLSASGIRFQQAPDVPGRSVVPQELITKYQSEMQEQEKRLIRAADPSYVPPDMGIYYASSSKGKAQAPNNRFEAVQVELHLPVPLIDHIPVEGGAHEKGLFGGKNLVGMADMKKKGCVVYSLGVAGDSTFEQNMNSTIGCEVHAFDCTINANAKSVKGKSFQFHEWCIGNSKDTEEKDIDMSGLEGNYLKGDNVGKQLVFKTLGQSMKELGHSSMDLLKFDIEGFEWQLFENELLKGSVKPKQISFELHTDGAKPWAVPKGNSDGKKNHEVNKLFLGLHKLGYRVVSKEVNLHDKACAEFVMVLV
jgi:hypothetical protein